MGNAVYHFVTLEKFSNTSIRKYNVTEVLQQKSISYSANETKSALLQHILLYKTQSKIY